MDSMTLMYKYDQLRLYKFAHDNNLLTEDLLNQEMVEEGHWEYLSESIEKFLKKFFNKYDTGLVEADLPVKYPWVNTDDLSSWYYILNSTELDEYFSLVESIKKVLQNKLSDEEYNAFIIENDSKLFGLDDAYTYLSLISDSLNGYITDQRFYKDKGEFHWIVLVPEDYNLPVDIKAVKYCFKLFKHIKKYIPIMKKFLKNLRSDGIDAFGK